MYNDFLLISKSIQYDLIDRFQTLNKLETNSNRVVKDEQKSFKIELYKKSESNLLFEYFTNHWNYNKDLRYSYLFVYFQDNHNESIYKTDFERYIRERFNFVGKFQYDKTTNEKNFTQLKELEKEFSKN
jgi:hypothetical protein